MPSERRRSLTLSLLLLSSVFLAAFAPVVAADDRVLLDLSNDHLVIGQGESANLTLTIENNDSSIRDFDLSVDDSLTSAAWNVSLADTHIAGVLPTFSTSTTVIVHLAADATLDDGGTVDILVAHAGTNISSTITLHLSVTPSWLPEIDHTTAGDAGLVTLEAGDTVNLSIPVKNAGSALDHIVLAVDETADLADFWANWGGGQPTNGSEGGDNGTNNTGNNTGGNNTGGNNTNGTGNGTLGPVQLLLNSSAGNGTLAAFLDSVNLTANLSYLVDWDLRLNGSVVPHDAGAYNWTSDGSDHAWNRSWNLSAGEWCFTASLRANLSTLDSVASCQQVSVSNGSGGNGTSMGRAAPTGWQAHWVDSTLQNMSAGETRMATLTLQVPLGESPGDHGLLLSAGSAMGNFTISETIVVRVNGTHNLTISADDAGVNWLPNGTGDVTFTVHNAGSAEAESIYSLLAVDGECSATLEAADADGARLGAGASEEVPVSVQIDADAGEGDECDLTLGAWDEIGETGHAHTFILTVGAAHGLAWVSTEDLLLTPGTPGSGLVTVRNVGTESADIRLVVASEDLSVSADAAFVTVAAGETADLSWSAETPAETDVVGTVSVDLSVETDDASATLLGSTNVSVLPWSDIRLSGPAGSAFTVDADAPTVVDFTVENDGTGSAEAVLDWLGAPLGFTVSVDAGDSVEAGASASLAMTVEVDASVASGSYDFTVLTVDPIDRSEWDRTEITAHVSQRAEVRLLLASDAKPVSSRADTSFTATVVNDGNEPDTFAISISGAAGFDVTISPQNLGLDAGESADVTLTLRRTGATGDVEMTLSAESQADAAVSDAVGLTATVPAVAVQVTAATNTDAIAAGGDVHLTLFLENLGEAEDTLLVTGPAGFACDHPSQVTLAAGAAASSHAVTCTADAGSAAGSHWLNYTVTSLTDAAVMDGTADAVEIAPTRAADGSPLLAVTLSGDDWSLPWNSSATYTVTVTNAGNEPITGNLVLAGEDVDALHPAWSMAESGQAVNLFSVASGASSTYTLTLTAGGEPDIGTIDFRVEASGTLGDGQGYAVASETVTMTVEHSPAPPTEAELWEGGPMVNAGDLAVAMLTGWIFAALLLLFIRASARRRAGDATKDAWDAAAEEESKDDDLAQGEIRPDEDGTARCHACEARIRLPTEKDAPFRFKCPTCTEMNRVMPPRED